MPITIKKLSSKERNQSLIKRFTNAFNNARMLDEVRSKMFRMKKINKTTRKKVAARKRVLKAKYDYLEKMGKIQKKTIPVKSSSGF